MAEPTSVKILVLDDEPLMLKLLARMLDNLGYTQVITFHSGLKALEWISGPSSPPDVIVCDLFMPEMDGIEFVRNLVERQYVGNVILTSGVDKRVLQTAEKLVQTKDICILGCLHKPFEPESLVVMLDMITPQVLDAPQAAIKKIYRADEVHAGITNRELVNFYQPQIDVATDQVVGVETLVRWQHPIDGLVFPDQFIGVAEEQGLIDNLTQVVLSGALIQVRAWQDAGLSLRVAINVSMKNLKSLDFPDLVAKHAAMAGVSPQNVVLEVTESRLTHDPHVSLEILMRLRLKGFVLSIDDFGTGHSSLAQLRDIPFNELKVDQSFVHGAWSDETNRTIYHAGLGLAKQLGMSVVAEGVEDQHDWDFVRGTRCDLAQGYYIARPMPAGELLDWIASKRHNLYTFSGQHSRSGVKAR